mmetsp:Transcript_15309/g.40813  ORF Transcript_15309/g.40813 Transcript_15309/m.40813 type:complete len:294 (+) Transcript_15309:893-1774(+)
MGKATATASCSAASRTTWHRRGQTKTTRRTTPFARASSSSTYRPRWSLRAGARMTAMTLARRTIASSISTAFSKRSWDQRSLKRTPTSWTRCARRSRWAATPQRSWASRRSCCSTPSRRWRATSRARAGSAARRIVWRASSTRVSRKAAVCRMHSCSRTSKPHGARGRRRWTAGPTGTGRGASAPTAPTTRITSTGASWSERAPWSIGAGSVTVDLAAQPSRHSNLWQPEAAQGPRARAFALCSFSPACFSNDVRPGLLLKRRAYQAACFSSDCRHFGTLHVRGSPHSFGGKS